MKIFFNIKSLLFFLFFVSGFCGLLYQIIWLRIAFASFGVISPILSVVISVFMLGLSLGSWAGGKWTPYLKEKNKFFSQTTHTYLKEGRPMGLLLGGGYRYQSPWAPDEATWLVASR